jgi:hypothetical protein
VVYLVDKGGVRALSGSADDDLLGAAIEVLGRVVAAGEDAGGLDDDVRADVAPGDLGRIALGEGLYLAVADAQYVAVKLDVLGPDPVHRITLEQERQPIHRREVVRRHDLDVFATVLDRRLGDHHPDPAEPIYPYSYGHSFLRSPSLATLFIVTQSPGI